MTKLRKMLLDKELIACANILEGLKSLYMLEGKQTFRKETVLICKTRNILVDRIITTAKENHPDEIPCIVTMPITGGNEDYLDWVQVSTKNTTAFNVDI